MSPLMVVASVWMVGVMSLLVVAFVASKSADTRSTLGAIAGGYLFALGVVAWLITSYLAHLTN